MYSKPASTVAPPERRLAAILAADIAGHALLTGDDDDAAHRRVSRELGRLRSAIRHASGTIFSFAGDATMAEFASATEALKCALLIQAASARRMAGAARPIRFRVAVNAGEILAGNRHIGSTAISLAARLERIAPPGGIALPATLHDQLRSAVAVPAAPIGRPELHDQAGPVVVAISADACQAWSNGTRTTRASALTRSAADPRAALAIIPFGGRGELDPFANAATDGVIRALGGMGTWIAVSRMQPGAIHGPVDLHRVRQTSGARYVLQGSVEAETNMLRLTVELNEAYSGRVLWSDRFDHLREHQAELRDDAAARIARAVSPLLLQRELDRAAMAPAGMLTAHDLALRAFAAIMQPERSSFAEAAEMLRHAEKRPGPHASTCFARVWWHFMAISQGWSTDPAAEAHAAADVAARMDRNDPAAMALLAFMHSVLHRDHVLASAMLDRVIDTAPSCGLAESLQGLTLSWLGDTRTAILHTERADTMPALGIERAWRDHVAAGAHYIAGRYADAARWSRVSAMNHPGLAANARILAASLAVLGRLAEAQQAARQLLAIDPNFRIDSWRRRAMLPEESRETLAQRMRLAGLPA
jgi:class 3 adenylate cyclase/tetratricopeptide (TPR) repeat protein